MKTENVRKVAVTVLIIGVISLVLGIIGKVGGIDIAKLGPRVFAGFAMICFLLSINLLLLEKKP